MTIREFDILYRHHLLERYRAGAHVIAYTYELHRNPEKRVDPFTIEEFIPGFEHSDEMDDFQHGEAMLEKARTFVSLFGGEDLTKGHHIQIMIPREEMEDD